jgi:hypothetical protein
MISVPNLRQLLNGNKKLCGRWQIGISLSLLLFACGAPKTVTAPTKPEEPKQVSKPEVYNPATQKMESANPQNTRVDTIRWKDAGIPPYIHDGSFDPTSHTNALAEKKHRIALLLPLSEEDLNKDLNSEGNEKYFHYYAGMKLAINKLQDVQAEIQLNVFDVKSAQDAILNVLKNEPVMESDLIIGPLRRDHLNATAKLAALRDIPMVAPWNSFRTIENINPNYILLKSSLPTHCEVLTQYILKNFKPTDVAILGREKNKSLVQYFQAEFQRAMPAKPMSITQCLIKDDHRWSDEFRYLDTTKSVYIVTEFEEPDIVFNFLRHLNVMRKSRDITVIGMPSWQDYGRDYNALFNQLNVTITASTFPNYEESTVTEFKSEFFKQYQTFPLRDAYEGYDHTMFLSRMVDKYGRKFHLNGDSDTYQGLATTIRLEKIIDTSKPIDDRLENVQCVENKSLHLLRFDQFRFAKIQ